MTSAGWAPVRRGCPLYRSRVCLCRSEGQRWTSRDQTVCRTHCWQTWRVWMYWKFIVTFHTSAMFGVTKFIVIYYTPSLFQVPSRAHPNNKAQPQEHFYRLQHITNPTINPQQWCRTPTNCSPYPVIQPIPCSDGDTPTNNIFTRRLTHPFFNNRETYFRVPAALL